MSNSLDPDQAKLFVGPGLRPIVCKIYQQRTLEGKEVILYLTKQRLTKTEGKCVREWSAHIKHEVKL